MGQFNLEADAALRQVDWEEIEKTPGGEFAEVIGDLLALIGSGSPLAVAGKASNLLLKIRKLAGASYTANLIYMVSAVRNDLSDLYSKHADLRQRIESLQTNPDFAEAISALALRAMDTSVKGRLKRLARIVANGVKHDDLESESLDDMLRAAVQLKEADLVLLSEIYKMLSPFIKTDHWLNRQIGEKWNILSGYWQKYWDENQTRYRGLGGQRLMGSFGRLESLGLIAPGPNRSSASSPVASCYLLLPDGMKFYERLQEIGTAE